MKRIVILFLLVLFLVTACASGDPAVEPTKTKKPTRTPVQSGPLATAQALGQQVTIIPPTPAGGADELIASDDYAGIFEQAWGIIQANYVRDDFNGVDWEAVHDEYLPRFEAVQTQEEHWALMAEFVAELGDDHSRFVPPERMEAEFGVDTADSAEPRPWTGVEVWPAKEDEQLLIWHVCAQGPGADAGLKRGDVILAIDGQPMEKGEDGWTREARALALFGSGGDTVTFSVLQGADSEPKDVTLTLGGAAGCDDWQYGIVSQSPYIGYIRIPDFDGDADANIYNALLEMEKNQPLDGLILDIRHNPGGNSDRSIAVFTEGVVGTEGPMRSDKSRTVYRIRGPVRWNDTTPVVVLQDGNSHSAADYFPAAMKELERAIIIGMPSAGNTEGINSFSLADGTLIRLAWTALLLNDGSSIEGVGVMPDVQIPLGDWGLRQEPFDAQLQGAIDYLMEALAE
jgi:C-terminal peptidase prc